MRTFWDAHKGQKICTHVGSFLTPLSLVWPRSQVKTDKIIPWEKVSTAGIGGILTRQNQTDRVHQNIYGLERLPDEMIGFDRVALDNIHPHSAATQDGF